MKNILPCVPLSLSSFPLFLFSRSKLQVVIIKVMICWSVVSEDANVNWSWTRSNISIARWLTSCWREGCSILENKDRLIHSILRVSLFLTLTLFKSAFHSLPLHHCLQSSLLFPCYKVLECWAWLKEVHLSPSLSFLIVDIVDDAVALRYDNRWWGKELKKIGRKGIGRERGEKKGEKEREKGGRNKRDFVFKKEKATSLLLTSSNSSFSSLFLWRRRKK